MALGGAAAVVSRDALGGLSSSSSLAVVSGGWRLRWASETVEVESSS